MARAITSPHSRSNWAASSGINAAQTRTGEASANGGCFGFGCGWAAAAAVTGPLWVWDWLGCHRLGFGLGRVGVDGWAFPSSQRPW